MSETLPNPQDFIGDDDDEELVFDEAPAVAPVTSPAAAPKLSKGRAGKRAAPATESAPAPEPVRIENPTPSSSAVTAPAASVEEPAGGAPAPFPPHGAESAGSRTNPFLLAIVGLALLSSLLSVGGLIAVGRTLAEANVARREAEARRDALAGVPAMVAQLRTATDRLDAASARAAAAAPSGPPATIEDVRHELDVLKLALAQHQPDGVSALTGTTQSGFAEVAERLDRLSDQLNRTQGASVSASPPASRGAYPRHSS
ncbi:hypothetical protein [Sphingomonas sp. PR090111-T3T-6A]|uniref:hypothetical protein n=1 Tax=Sphingomonas sp. PR090111-T3T-6A TaxID=685778 RepID=UPI000362DC3D|nr:hypothetical protein [Sphingomonas sp. PR090111-T3T-6A]